MALLTGCSTIVTGTTQTLTVVTPELEGAKCALTDSKGGVWSISETPGRATVRKGDGPMTITCKKEGYATETVLVQEEFAGATIGNVILGGGIGIFVDAVSGAAQIYPDMITVWMKPNKWPSDASRIEWEAKKEAFDRAVEERERLKHQFDDENNNSITGRR
ncbi:MAG: hypothetical protein HQL54_02565 [Magnetococcales bacterium]|nr:hypothetical protein [Magnetococcales bacterium]